MARVSRRNLNTPFLHIMVQGINKDYIFDKDYYKELYLNLIKEHNAEKNVDILAYCIMSNHAHFAVYNEDKEALGKLMQEVNLNFSKMYNKRENRCGALFRNRYRVQPIFDERQLLNCINYIHLNPVKAKMVKKCEDYKYSSFMDYKMNRELAKAQILQRIFGEKFDYIESFKNRQDRLFMDIDEYSDADFKKYIGIVLQEFIKENQKNIVDIFLDRYCLKALIKYLKEECGIPYVNIQNYFEIPRGTMNRLKI